MKNSVAKSLIAKSLIALSCLTANSAVWAVDFAFFQGQTCKELGKEFEQLKLAEKAALDAMAKEKDRAAREKGLAVASALLLGFGWWSSADHSDTNQIQAEIRDDLRMVTRAAGQKKCKIVGL